VPVVTVTDILANGLIGFQVGRSIAEPTDMVSHPDVCIQTLLAYIHLNRRLQYGIRSLPLNRTYDTDPLSATGMTPLPPTIAEN
jgi:hypothetical protein